MTEGVNPFPNHERRLRETMDRFPFREEVFARFSRVDTIRATNELLMEHETTLNKHRALS